MGGAALNRNYAVRQCSCLLEMALLSMHADLNCGKCRRAAHPLSLGAGRRSAWCDGQHHGMLQVNSNKSHWNKSRRRASLLRWDDSGRTVIEHSQSILTLIVADRNGGVGANCRSTGASLSPLCRSRGERQLAGLSHGNATSSIQEVGCTDQILGSQHPNEITRRGHQDDLSVT